MKNDFVGGGFGCKGFVWPHQLLAALAAREVGRPVKLVLTRAQSYTAHGYQPATEQAITLAAERDGRLTAIRHHATCPSAMSDDYMEYAAIGTRALYACASIATQHRAVRVNRSKPTPMRAPHEGPGLFALESAMDELAYELRLDPLDLRLRNYAEVDPTRGVPFSSKKLRECYLEGRAGSAGPPAIRCRGQRGSGESSSAWAWPARSCRRFAMPRRLGSRSIGRARCGSRAARRRSAPVSPLSCPRSRRMCLACRSSASSLSLGTRTCRQPR